MTPLLRVGLTGGIGSGKSTVLGLLAASGAAPIDADAISRGTTAVGGTAIEGIASAFGAAAIAKDGSMNRAWMRELVFRDPAARARLEAIVHPWVQAGIARELAVAEAKGFRAAVLDIPLLVESGRWRSRLDRVLVVDCDPETQVRRVVARSGLTPEAVRAIIASQANRADRRAAADAVICNDVLTYEALSDAARRIAHTFGL